jgi:NTE family protein
MNKLVGLFLLVMVTVTTGPAPAADAAKTKDADFRPLAAPANRDPDVLVPPTEVSETSKETFAEKTPQKRPRLILALGGGAFKSVAQIGVLNCLKDNGIEIDGVVGTSLGATIGALYCAGMSPAEIEALFVEKKMQKAMMKGMIVRTVLKPLAPAKHLILGKPLAGLSTGKGYLSLLRKNLPENFSQLKKPFAAVATNITDGQTSALTEGDLPLSVLASNSVPTVFRPVEIDGKMYVDGGLKANLPNHIADKLGAELTVSVLCDKAIKPVDNKTFKSMKSIMLRVADIMMAAADHPKAEASDILIFPDVDFVPPFTKDPDVIKKAIAVGYHATEQVMPQLKSQLLALQNGQSTKQTAAKNLKEELR